MGRMSKPQKNDNDRILECVRNVKETKCEISFQHIVHALHGYLQHLSLKKFFFVAGSNSDDIYQEGLYALATKAIPDYDENKGPFIGFAKLCIRRHIITILKTANNNKNRALNMSVSMDATVCHDEEDGPVSISGFLPNGEEGIVEGLVRGESYARLKESLLTKLTSLEAKVLDLYLQNMSYIDIVTLMNKTRRGRNRVNCKVIDNALCRIKKKAMELDDSLINNGNSEDADCQETEE
jgi:RNA polymerase sporulation-specific sigma factor